jgi:catechol 2,3-dioxygenase-like lactoylglutathione lyase family enzyme
MSIRAQRLLRVSITAADLARTAAFYRDALDFLPVAEREIDDTAWFRLMGEEGGSARSLRMRLGAQELEFSAFDPPGRPYPAGSTAHDPWFQHVAIVVSDMAAAWERLREFNVLPITCGGPQRLPPNTGSVTAFKFRDPEDHPLELIQFPPGVGDPVWQQHARDALFLGIDHSAIVVRDVPRSLAFYTDTLGLSEASRSLNLGPEQERLDNTPGVLVDVVALHPAAAATPHVELLGYRTPRITDAPTDLSVRDIASARFVFACTDLSTSLSDVQRLSESQRAALVADPDGHRLFLVEQHDAAR